MLFAESALFLRHQAVTITLGRFSIWIVSVEGAGIRIEFEAKAGCSAVSSRGYWAITAVAEPRDPVFRRSGAILARNPDRGRSGSRPAVHGDGRTGLGRGPIIMAGVLFLLSNLGIIHGDVWRFLWPAILIMVGLAMLARSMDRHATGGAGAGMDPAAMRDELRNRIVSKMGGTGKFDNAGKYWSTNSIDN